MCFEMSRRDGGGVKCVEVVPFRLKEHGVLTRLFKEVYGLVNSSYPLMPLVRLEIETDPAS
jgi:hypothetical protein